MVVYGFMGLGLFFVFLLGCYGWISWMASPYLYEDADKIPYQDTVLVLGTAKLTGMGGENLYFKSRMDAAGRLYHRGKVSRLIVSGGSEGSLTSQARDMKESLIGRGVPATVILADDRGYRTWDSLWRCREIFGCHDAIVISQRFHNQRAVFLGRRQGMRLIGYNAGRVGGRVAIYMFVRESLARVKCLMDLYWLHPLPGYLRNGMDVKN